MAVSIPHTGTEYAANSITMNRGTTADIVEVGVYHTADPNEVPDPTDFTIVTLVTPGDPLADGNNTDILSLIGPRDGDLTLATGDYQRWVYVKTATEDILRKIDTLTIL
jgi:hypothetical protein